MYLAPAPLVMPLNGKSKSKSKRILLWVAIIHMHQYFQAGEEWLICHYLVSEPILAWIKCQGRFCILLLLLAVYLAQEVSHTGCFRVLVIVTGKKATKRDQGFYKENLQRTISLSKHFGSNWKSCHKKGKEVSKLVNADQPIKNKQYVSSLINIIRFLRKKTAGNRKCFLKKHWRHETSSPNWTTWLKMANVVKTIPWNSIYTSLDKVYTLKYTEQCWDSRYSWGGRM